MNIREKVDRILQNVNQDIKDMTEEEFAEYISILQLDLSKVYETYETVKSIECDIEIYKGDNEI